ncbi:MAG: hypothetical protein R3B52_00595 [Candidatus Paceibacterota bacterium]
MKKTVDTVIRFATIGFGLALGIVLLGFALQVFAVLFTIALSIAIVFAGIYFLAKLYKYLTNPKTKKSFIDVEPTEKE